MTVGAPPNVVIGTAIIDDVGSNTGGDVIFAVPEVELAKNSAEVECAHPQTEHPQSSE